MGNLGDLKAQQLILLAVFVSFVTSVATGITTVSIIEAAPQPVQQVVNRIVERTVERVVPEEKTDDGDDEKPVQKEVVTVVVKEEDLAVGAAEALSKNVARVYVRGGGDFVSLGVVVGPNRVVADGAQVLDGGNYEVEVGGVRATATVIREGNGFALLSTPDSGPAFTPATLGSVSSLKLAQSLIAVTGRGSTSVATGALTSLPKNADGSAVIAVEAALRGGEILPGATLANIRGEVVGMWLADGSAPSTFSTVDALAAFAAAS